MWAWSNPKCGNGALSFYDVSDPDFYTKWYFFDFLRKYLIFFCFFKDFLHFLDVFRGFEKMCGKFEKVWEGWERNGEVVGGTIEGVVVDWILMWR